MVLGRCLLLGYLDPDDRQDVRSRSDGGSVRVAESGGSSGP